VRHIITLALNHLIKYAASIESIWYSIYLIIKESDEEEKKSIERRIYNKGSQKKMKCSTAE